MQSEIQEELDTVGVVVDGSFFEEQEETGFNVTLGSDEPTVVQGRLEAVAFAKSLSVEHDRRVVLERVDGRVLMQFSGGSLDSFVWETRPGK